jgi:hypothetical protein
MGQHFRTLFVRLNFRIQQHNCRLHPLVLTGYRRLALLSVNLWTSRSCDTALNTSNSTQGIVSDSIDLQYFTNTPNYLPYMLRPTYTFRTKGFGISGDFSDCIQFELLCLRNFADFFIRSKQILLRRHFRIIIPTLCNLNY